MVTMISGEQRVYSLFLCPHRSFIKKDVTISGSKQLTVTQIPAFLIDTLTASDPCHMMTTWLEAQFAFCPSKTSAGSSVSCITNAT